MADILNLTKVHNGRRPAISRLVRFTAVLMVGTTVFAQRPDFRSFTNTGRLPGGLQLDSLTWNADYFDLSVPKGILPTSLPLGSVFGVGAGIRLGWYLRGSRTDFEIQYDGEYNGFTRYTQLRGLDQTVSLIFRRKLTPKLEWDWFANGQSTRLSELLLRPSSALTIAQGAGTIDDLSAAISTGASQDAGLNPTAAAASSVESPFMLALSGARLYVSSVATSFLYSETPKLVWFGRVHASRLWYRQDQTGVDERGLFVPPHDDIAATSGFAYVIGRRTELGLNLDYDRSHSAYHVANAADLALSLTRHLGKRWLISGAGGPGAVIGKNRGQPSTRSEGYNAAGTIGYKGLAHTIMLSAQRSVSGRLGLGEDHTASGSLVWSWQERGSPWTLGSSVSYERLGGGGIRQLQAWLVSVSATRRLSPRTNIVVAFVNASDSAPTIGALNGITRRAARIALEWTPSPRSGYRR